MTQSADSPALKVFEGLRLYCDLLGQKESLSSLGAGVHHRTKLVKELITSLSFTCHSFDKGVDTPLTTLVATLSSLCHACTRVRTYQARIAHLLFNSRKLAYALMVGSKLPTLRASAQSIHDVYVSNLSWLWVGGCVGLHKFSSEFFTLGFSEMILGISGSYAGCKI